MAQVTQQVSSTGTTFEESYTISAADRRRLALEEVKKKKRNLLFWKKDR
jgi:PHS family inorganic phosphate transporter-like MFS transporter